MQLFLIPLIVVTIFLASCGVTSKQKAAVRTPARDADIADVKRIPQRLNEIAEAAGDRLSIDPYCKDQLLQEFESNFFRPWISQVPLFDLKEARHFMSQQGRVKWLGVNRRTVPAKQMQALLDNCALDSFPSRNLPAIAVAPAHLRSLPTQLPLYRLSEGPPFDMLSYPQLKLNEPLRVLHASRDGAWYFVESPYSNGWIATRDVAFVDADFIRKWLQGPLVVAIKDMAPVGDGKGVVKLPVKIGTILPSAGTGMGWIAVKVASAGEGGIAEAGVARLAADTAAPFPVPFNKELVSLIGNQMLGQPYGWGEIYGLRDCSALLRDFFLPFGIWMPRTAIDQIESVRNRVDLKQLGPEEKEEVIKKKGIPFLTLLYKKGHIMLYVGMDQEGRPLVFQNAWSIRVKEEKGERTKIIGSTVITTLKPGAELGLVKGQSLLERASALGTVTDRCEMLAKKPPPKREVKTDAKTRNPELRIEPMTPKPEDGSVATNPQGRSEVTTPNPEGRSDATAPKSEGRSEAAAPKSDDASQLATPKPERTSEAPGGRPLSDIPFPGGGGSGRGNTAGVSGVLAHESGR